MNMAKLFSEYPNERTSIYRGFVEQGSEDNFQIALARVYEKGNVEIYIDFVKVKDKWNYNGHVTN
jgi:hypothetical protein